MKADKDLRDIPVVILMTSQVEADVWRSYRLHANANLPKPVGFENFLEMMRAF